MRRYPIYPIIFMLIISILANGLSLSFRGEVFAHELDHAHQALSLDPATHLESHRTNVSKDGADLDATTHLCLHSTGQYQPFFFNSFPSYRFFPSVHFSIPVLSVNNVVFPLPLFFFLSYLFCFSY